MQNIPARRPIQFSAFLVVLLFLCRASAAQFVELTAELEINDWSYWFFEDRLGLVARSGKSPSTVFTTSAPIRCVIGTNTWMMENDFGNGKLTRWFTGSNILECSLITKAMSEEEIKRLSQTTRLAMSSPRVGDPPTRVYETADGNPGRPVRVLDLFTDASGMMSWLAFCSGSALKRPGRQIPPPSAFWKEYFSGDSLDETIMKSLFTITIAAFVVLATPHLVAAEASPPVALSLIGRTNDVAGKPIVRLSNSHN